MSQLLDPALDAEEFARDGGSDLVKAVKGATQAGLSIARVVIAPDGTIVVVAGKPGQMQDAATEANE